MRKNSRVSSRVTRSEVAGDAAPRASAWSRRAGRGRGWPPSASKIRSTMSGECTKVKDRLHWLRSNRRPETPSLCRRLQEADEKFCGTPGAKFASGLSDLPKLMIEREDMKSFRERLDVRSQRHRSPPRPCKQHHRRAATGLQVVQADGGDADAGALHRRGVALRAQVRRHPAARLQATATTSQLFSRNQLPQNMPAIAAGDGGAARAATSFSTAKSTWDGAQRLSRLRHPVAGRPQTHGAAARRAPQRCSSSCRSTAPMRRVALLDDRGAVGARRAARAGKA